MNRRDFCKLSGMGLLSTAVSSTFGLSSAAAFAAPLDYTFPPEWAPQSSVWLCWDATDDLLRTTDAPMHAVVAQIVEALHAHDTKVEMMVSGDDARADCLNFFQSYQIDPQRIRFHTYHKTYIFMRDMGPLFVKTTDGKPMIADFAWRYYGIWNEGRGKAIGDVDKAMAAELNIPTIESRIFAEGGGFEVNGEGVLMGYQDMAMQRNPDKTLAQIESELLRLYGQKKMLWLPLSPLSDVLTADGSPIIENFFGYGANGHVDEVARFVGPNTILVAQVSEEARNHNTLERIDYERIEETVRVLQNATDANGSPFNIIRITNPDLSMLWKERPIAPGQEAWGFKVGDTVIDLPASSYLNFLITNNLVLMAKYWEPGKPEKLRELDEAARATLQSVFPSHDIKQINPLAINWWGGGIHCITQQTPVFNV